VKQSFLIGFQILILFFTRLPQAISQELSLLNRGEYWVEEKDQREFFKDRFDADYIWGDFRFGVRFEMDEEARIDTLLFSGISKRFCQYKRDFLTLTVGNYYATFGRGLILREFAEEELYFDRDFDGVRLLGSFPLTDFTFLVGRPLDPATRKRENLLYGLDFKGRLQNLLTLGTSYVRSDATNTPTDPSFGLPVEELLGFNWSFDYKGLNFYGEAARRYTWGEYEVGSGWVGKENVKGRGIYLTTNLALYGLGLALEYKNFQNLDSRFNSPPTCNRTGKPLNNGKDERGFQAEFNASPLNYLTILTSYSEVTSPRYNQSLKDGYGEFQLRSGENWLFEGAILNTEERGWEAAILKKREKGLSGDLSYSLNEFSSLSLSTEYKRVSTDYVNRSGFLYHLGKVILSYSYAPKIILSFSMEKASRKVPEYAWEDLWILGEITFRLSEKHEFQLREGHERGGIVCSGGVCRYEPPFKGLRASFVSRF